MNPVISIIVPIYNTSAYLAKCIDSIINQTYKSTEIILVDDGSTDNSLEICHEYQKKDKRIVCIHKTNGGLSSARNAGLKIAKGEYVGFIDSDDYIEKNMYESLLNYLIKNNCDMVCCGRFDIVDGQKHPGLCPNENKILTNIETLNKLFVWDGLDSSVCDKLFKKQLFDSTSFPLNVRCEDVGTTYKLIYKSNKIGLISSRFYNYFHHDNSITTSSFDEHSFDFETHTKEIKNFIETNHLHAIEESGSKFRMASIKYTITFIKLIKHREYKRYKKRFNSYKNELLDYYKGKEMPNIVQQYIHKTLRFHYYYKAIRHTIHIMLIKIKIMKH